LRILNLRIAVLKKKEWLVFDPYIFHSRAANGITLTVRPHTKAVHTTKKTQIMKRFCLLVTCALTLAVSIGAQTSDLSSIVKTPKGVLVVSNEPGNYFTAEINGKTVKQDPIAPYA
jgi:hypothetical protein